MSCAVQFAALPSTIPKTNAKISMKFRFLSSLNTITVGLLSSLGGELSCRRPRSRPAIGYLGHPLTFLSPSRRGLAFMFDAATQKRALGRHCKVDS